MRNLLYDALQYARQVEETARNHREQKDYKGRDRGEFLSGFYREDKLLPVITLVVFFSPKEWDGPRSLREMMAPKDVVIRSMLPDYQLHLVSPAELSKADFGKFHTSLGDVLEFIKYSMDKDKLVEWLEGEKQDLVLGQKEVEVLNACVNADLRIQPEEEGVKMCKAIQDWKAEWQREMAPILKEQLRGEVTKQVTEQVTKQVTEQTGNGTDNGTGNGTDNGTGNKTDNKTGNRKQSAVQPEKFNAQSAADRRTGRGGIGDFQGGYGTAFAKTVNQATSGRGLKAWIRQNRV